MYRAVDHNFFKNWSQEMAYVLGYFAADGTMVKHKNGGCFIEFHSTDKWLIATDVFILSDISKRSYTARWVFQSRFTSGSKRFLSHLRIMLKTHGMHGGFVYRKERGHELVFSHRDSVALYRLMYDTVPDGSPHLKRKYRLFRKAVRTLHGEELRV